MELEERDHQDRENPIRLESHASVDGSYRDYCLPDTQVVETARSLDLKIRRGDDGYEDHSTNRSK